MCTVSFVSSGGRYFITSNRDEHISRPLALQPKEETIGSVKVLFPKDPKAGGTWFALNEFGAVGVLLNGAFVNHQLGGIYAKSRGLVLLDIISSNNPVGVLKEMELYQIEPFTLVLFDMGLMEFRWDGNQKYFRKLDTAQNHIWSSATLYSDEIIQHRAKIFDRFQANRNEIESSDIMDFHSNNHNDFENGFIIDRESGLKTFSVTQAILGEDQILMKHLDLLNDKVFEVPFSAGELTF